MFKVFQGVLVVAGLGLAFGAGYGLKPANVTPKPAVPATVAAPAAELRDFAPAVDIRLPVGEMTPIASVPVDRDDITFKMIEKELGIDTTPVSGPKSEKKREWVLGAGAN